MGLFADKLEYLEGTKTAIKNAIVAQGTPILETDTFRSYADKIMSIDTFSDAWTDTQEPLVDMVKLKKILVDDIQPDQGNKKILLALSNRAFGFNTGLIAPYENVSGFKIVGEGYWSRSEMDLLDNSVFSKKIHYSKYQRSLGLCIVIIYFNNETTEISSFQSINSSNIFYLCLQNINISSNCMNSSGILYDMINCKVTTTGSGFDFNSSFPNYIANSDYLQENKTVNFENASSLCDISHIDFLKNPLSGSFRYARSIGSIPNIILDSSVTTLEEFFYECHSVRTIGTIDTSKITTMKSMFSNCYSLQSPPFMDTSKVTSMYYMFQNCASLKTIPKLNLAVCTETSYMFNGCESLESVEFENAILNTSAYSMFGNCKSLKSIIGLDGSKMNQGSLSDAFDGCVSLETLGFSNINSQIDLYDCRLLSKSSVLSLIDNLTPYTYGGYLGVKIPEATYALLTKAEIKVANLKMWDITDGVERPITLGVTTGTLAVGSTLTAGEVKIGGESAVAGEEFTYQWASSDYYSTDDIVGATNSTYVVQQADIGKYIILRVQGTLVNSQKIASYTCVGTVIDPTDIVAPTVLALTQTASSDNVEFINVQSSEATGFVYIVRNDKPQVTKYDLDLAAAGAYGERIAITAANTDMPIPASGLWGGIYNAYAVDAACNISTVSPSVLTITKLPVAVTSNAFFTLSTDTIMKIEIVGGKFRTGTITSADFTFTGTNVARFSLATYTRTSDTMVTVSGLSSMVLSEIDTVTIKGVAQEIQVGSINIEMTDAVGLTEYNSLPTLVGNVTGMTTLTSVSDSGGFKFPYLKHFVWSWDNSNSHYISTDGDSFMNPSGKGGYYYQDAVLFNKRDSKILSTKMLGGIHNGIKFNKISWLGAAYYSTAQDQIWELYLFENGDAMIYANTLSTSYNDGTYSFFGKTYSVSAASRAVSFYRQDVEGTQWTVASELYDYTKSLNLV